MDIKKYAETFFKFDKPASKKDWERVYRSMIVHTRGVTPKELLEIKRPNEPPELTKYRIANFKPITKHGINQAIDAVYRVLSDSNYSITYSDNIYDYLTEKQFEFFGERLDFKQLFFRHILRIIFDDPNGLLVWMPEHPTDKTKRPIEAEGNEPIEIVPMYVNSEDIEHFTDEVISFEGGDWIVEYQFGQETKKEEHDYYFILTYDFIYRLVPYYDQAEKKIKYRLEEYYNLSQKNGINDPNKQFPTFVAHTLGGNVAISDKGYKYYDSFYGAYVPFGDDAICSYSDNQAVRVRYNFPFVEIKGQLCADCKGEGKMISKNKETLGLITVCSSCNGNGYTTPFTPFGQYVAMPPAPNDDPTFTSKPFMTFTSPDVGILDKSYETWKDLLQEAKKAVNLVFIEDAQSGIAKDKDREVKYETLIKIKNNFFELAQWSLNIIEAYRVPFVLDRKESKVSKPASLQILTQSQLTEELSDMIAKEMPASYIATTAKKLAEKIYSDDVEAQIIVDVLTIWDVLFGKTASQISTLKATGGATQKDVLRNVNGYAILAQLAQEEDLVDMEYSEIILKAEEKLQLLIPSTTLTLPQTLPNDAVANP